MSKLLKISKLAKASRARKVTLRLIGTQTGIMYLGDREKGQERAEKAQKCKGLYLYECAIVSGIVID